VSLELADRPVEEPVIHFQFTMGEPEELVAEPGDYEELPPA
jgi:hypothetical protein